MDAAGGDSLNYLTMKFLGEISDVQSNRVVECLSRLAGLDKFSVAVKGYGFFPDRRRPQVLWAGLVAPPTLAELACWIDRAMGSMGFPAEHRTFGPLDPHFVTTKASMGRILLKSERRAPPFWFWRTEWQQDLKAGS
jgi:2'-5' RNA ligase